MGSLQDSYESVYKKLKNCMDEYNAVVQKYNNASEMDAETRAQRIAHYNEQLEKIEEYTRRIDFYRKLAEKHMESKNLLATEGMSDIIGQPRELNFKHMHDWATYIDPTNSDDPYAQRIYVMAKCNEIYLKKKKEQFETNIKTLEEGRPADAEAAAQIESAKKAAVEFMRQIISGSEFTAFASDLKVRSDKYTDQKNLYTFRNEIDPDAKISLGSTDRRLPVFEELRTMVSDRISGQYNPKDSTVRIPFELSDSDEFIITATVNTGKEKKLYRALQNYILSRISAQPIGMVKVNVIDAIHFNSSSLGPLRALEQTSLIGDVPNDEEQVTDALKEIIAEFIEIDESLGMVDSVKEFNETCPKEEMLPRRILMAIGYPSAFSGEAQQLIDRIIMNHEHYGVTVITADNQFNLGRNADDHDKTRSFASNVVRLRMNEQVETMSVNNRAETVVYLSELKDTLPEDYVNGVNERDVKDSALGNEYIKRVEMHESFPAAYSRGNKKIVLPYGIDTKDEINTIAFNNENFASFLMGASGSGKSTLLHTLITGILNNYHPDDVELWLADFKMSEFAQYINPLPPHVRYILLDESPELVYDLIDKLTDRMMERQRYFMMNRNIKKVEDVPSSVYMPVIFIILDEFSIMSQAVAESTEYKLKLQNLLAKGRALGIKFLFSSQTFTKGIQGLTPTAKEQIQSRIAMKNSREEINETLELSAAQKTDKIRNWMDALPPHYVLYKFRENDSIQVKRMKVMYFAGKGEEAYQPQRDLIGRINDGLTKVANYDPSDDRSYLDKDPVIVDGNSYDGFRRTLIASKLKSYKESHGDEFTSEDTLFVLGTPRRMENFRVAALTEETRENVLFLSRNSEQMQSAAILLTLMKCFSIQNREVEIWAYSRDRLYRMFKNTHWNAFKVVEGTDDVKQAVHDLSTKIYAQEAGNKLIVMMGMERISADFEFSKPSKPASTIKGYTSNAAAAVSNDEEAAEQMRAQMWPIRKRELRAELKTKGKTKAEIDAALAEEHDKFFELPLEALQPKPAEPAVKEAEPQSKEEPVNELANVAEEFQDLFKLGSRLGYHFVVVSSSYLDFKQMQVKLDYFRHKLSFQLSNDDSITVFGNRRAASELPEHVCLYDNTIDRYSFRPYLHPGLTWDGWTAEDEEGTVISAFDEN